jgi:Tol biopolymer transport system component
LREALARESVSARNLWKRPYLSAKEVPVKTSYRIAVTIFVVLLVAIQAAAQLPKDPEERAKAIAQILQTNARQLTLYDREGKELNQVGARDLYQQPVFSPDAKRLAVIKVDVDKESNDLWVVDIGTGKTTRVSVSGERESAAAPAWSPDGSHVAYVGLRQGAYGLYQKLSNGEGAEELLYKSNAPLVLTDWSMDGRYLTFYSTDLGGGAIFALPLNGTGERKPIEIFRSTFQLTGPRLSPDDRFVAYVSNETGKTELYIRPFSPTATPGAAPSKGPWKLSEQGAQGMAFWRRDGKEISFLAPNRSIMSISLSTSPDFEFEKPKVLFGVPETTPVAPNSASVNRDADRFVIAVPPPQLRQLTLLDRDGKVQGTIGQPGRFGNIRFSPDGKKLLVVKNDPQTGNNNIWVLDIATGNAIAITNETQPINSPVWSNDGRQIAYVLFKDSYSSVYRKAADGTGDAELLFRYTPGAGVGLTDWSPDSKFLTFSTGVLLIVPLQSPEKPLERKALEWLREDYDAFEGRFSPDGRFLAYLSNEAEVATTQIYVRPFDSNKPEAPAGPAVQITSLKGGAGGVLWRKDGKEMYFLTRDREVMAVDITSGPKIQSGMPRMLFKISDPLAGAGDVSPDGQRFVVAMPVK